MDNFDNAIESLDIGTESIDETNKKLDKELIDLGIKEEEKDGKQQGFDKIFYGLTEADREQAVREFVVAKPYKYSTFDSEKIKENLIQERNKYKALKVGLYKVYDFAKYESICNNILSTIRARRLPARSYLIGAPNGFGKSSFVNECIITLRHHGFRVVPYISLWELAQIRVEYEKMLMSPYKKVKSTDNGNSAWYTEQLENKGIFKKPEIITGRYSYSEYINADCLFVSFTDVISKDIESHTLYQLLNIRGMKGLPTIVMMSTSLEPYENDKALREQVWDEIKDYDEKSGKYDRVYHISCYKRRTSDLENREANVDSNTGIVN